VHLGLGDGVDDGQMVHVRDEGDDEVICGEGMGGDVEGNGDGVGEGGGEDLGVGEDAAGWRFRLV
jgi:hypothetical protein